MTSVLQLFLSRCVRHGTLQGETAKGSRFTVGDGTGQPIAIRFMDRGAEYALVLDPALALGELVTDGRLLITTGSIYDLLELLGRNLILLTPPGLGKVHQLARRALIRVTQRNTTQRAQCNVAHHYDLDERLYALFLDTDWQYSCAYFEYPGQSLDDAQLAKKRHIAAKLLLAPGKRVLDIGSGWGGLALYLARHYRAKVTGITLSNGQLNAARERAIKNDAAQSVTFKKEDYRTVVGTFDRIVSVGMFEHVGIPQYDAFFNKCRDLLAADGVMLLHSIGRSDGPGATNPWVAKYIFPGGYSPALSEVLPSIERSGLIVTDIEILNLHYAETLSAWRQRFLAHRTEAVALFDERFCRMWEFYLAASEAAFRYGGLMVFQVQLAKRLDVVPLTRDYIAGREVELRSAEKHREELGVAAE